MDLSPKSAYFSPTYSVEKHMVVQTNYGAGVDVP